MKSGHKFHIISSLFIIVLCCVILTFCHDPDEIIPISDPTAIRVKEEVDAMAGIYKIIGLNVNGKDRMDSIKKYIEIDSCKQYFNDYKRNTISSTNRNLNFYQEYVFCSTNESHLKKINDTLKTDIGINSYKFKNYKVFDTVIINYVLRYFIYEDAKFIKVSKRIKPDFLNFLDTCLRKVTHDSLIFYDEKLDSKIIYKKISNLE